MNLNNQKGIAPIAIILIIAGVLILAGGVYYGSTRLTTNWQKTSAPAATPAISPTSTASIVMNQTANWKAYRNEQYGFEFRYPNEWVRNDWQVSGTTILGMDFSSPDYKVRSEYRGGEASQKIFEKGAQFAVYIDSLAAYSPYTFEELKSDKLKNSRVSKTTEIEVAGGKALYQVLGNYIPENAEVDVYFFSPKNNALLFTVYIKSTIEEKDSYFSIFDQILSTFKFTK